MPGLGPRPVDLLLNPARPDHPALVDISSGDSYSYRALLAQVEGLAQKFRALGAMPGAAVAIEAVKSAGAVIAILAAMRAGAVAAPLDPELPDARVDAIIGRIAPAILFGSTDWIAARQPSAPAARAVFANALPPPAEPADTVAHAAAEGHVALVLHTSGSTGRPKGVQLTEANIAAFLEGARLAVGYDAQTRFLNVCPLFFDASLLDLFGTWAAGGTVYLLEKPVLPGIITAALETCRITDTLLVSSVLRMLVGRFSDIRKRDLSALRSIWFGAESCPLEILREIDRIRPGLTYIHGYGPTETTHSATLAIVRDLSGTDGFLPIGAPLHHVMLRIETSDVAVAAAGETGELLIGGPQVMAGYLGEPERDRTALVMRDGARYYRTGDLVRADDRGNLWFVGRRDDGIKVNGNLVHLGEVEAAALAIEGIRDAIALAVPDAITGQAIHLVVISPEGGHRPEGIADAMAARLPAYMLPRAIHRRDGGDLPRGPNGKIDRAALRATLAADQDAPA